MIDQFLPGQIRTQPLCETAKKKSLDYVQKLNNSFISKISKGEFNIKPNQSETPAIGHSIQIDQSQKLLKESFQEKSILQNRLKELNGQIKVLKHRSIKSLKDSNTRSTQNLQERMKIFKIERQQEKTSLQKRKLREKQQSRQKQLQQSILLKQLRESRLETRRLSISQHLINLEQRAKKRREIQNQTNKKVLKILKNQKSIVKKTYPYQLQAIEEQNLRTKQIKQRIKPMKFRQFQQHQVRVQQYLKLREKEWKRRRSCENKAIPKLNISYISRYKKIEEQQKDEQQKIQEQLQRFKISRLNKKKQYSLKVQKLYKPSTDYRLQQEREKKLRESQEFLKKIGKKKEQSQRLIKLKGQEYLNHVKSLPKRNSKQSLSTEAYNPQEVHPYKNYLVHTQRGDYNRWDNILTESSCRAKLSEKILYEAEKVEDDLKRRSDRYRLINKNQQEASKIDNEYYKMMKAKLSILELA